VTEATLLLVPALTATALCTLCQLSEAAQTMGDQVAVMLEAAVASLAMALAEPLTKYGFILFLYLGMSCHRLQ
jgi:hypothetical protein